MIDLQRSSSATFLGLNYVEILTMEDENSTAQTIPGGGPGGASTWIVEENQNEIAIEEVGLVNLRRLLNTPQNHMIAGRFKLNVGKV